ncbi:DMT family transporter [Halobacillus rhizosphaerae]|uniref:DMT family transporter n=1 Tax=Halobacillus rhizosphaerae TaxID=3064889 RepID=UPI00398BA5CE
MELIIILFTLLGGITLSAQSSINGTFSQKAGTIETTLLTFVTGAIFLFLIILFFGQGDLSAIMAAPKWQLSAVFMGTIYLMFTVIAVPKIGVIAANISTIIGQLVISVIIDHFGWFGSIEIELGWDRMLALFFMALALYFIYKGNMRSKQQVREAES